MKDLKEMDFTTLKTSFDEVCDEINSGGEAAELTLKSGHRLYIIPEKNYNKISRFAIMLKTSANTTK